MRKFRSVLTCLLAGILILLCANPAAAQEKIKPKLAILPFVLNGTDDLAYLKEGVRTMLASRVAARGGVAVIGRGEVALAAAAGSTDDPAGVAKTLGADLVLTGSITAIGSGVSIDAQLLRLADNASESFFAVAENEGAIIGAVGQLADDLAANIAETARQAPAADGQRAASLPSAPAPDGAAEQSLHPDRLFKLPVPVPVPTVVAGPAPGVTAAAGPGPLLANSRSQFLDLEIQVMDVGDVFGDGASQVVIAEKQEITVFRQDGPRLLKAGTIPAAPRHVRIIGLNLADLNGNGRAEIYISANSDNNPFSYAVEWDGQAFVKLFDRQPHYLRPLLLPGQGWALFGQRADNNSPVKPGIFRADPFDGSLTQAAPLNLPATVNLFDFTVGDFTGDGRLEAAVLSQDDELRLYNPAGEVLWQGPGGYGYTRRYIGPTVSSLDSDQKNFQVPARLVALDLNGDGRQELVALVNPSGVATLLKTVDSFVGGAVKVMGWNGVTFNDLWSTGALGSYVASYQVGGVSPRLYIGMVSKKAGTLFNSRQSVVAGYSLAGMVK